MASLCIMQVACQGYDFVYQPDAVRSGVHLTFSVQTPSKADILFVIDNTGSMASKQTALANSINTLLTGLAPQDTSYRIGILSTDAHGFLEDCNSVPLPPVPSNTMSNPTLGAKGNAQRCQDVGLRRPHDGALGRLMAAYDPTVFDPNNFNNLDPNVQTALRQMLPTGPTTGPAGVNGVSGARWVIDRDAIRTEACNACGCSNCVQGDGCFQNCAEPAGQALVQAYFRSNIAGLGINGFGWTEGLKSALWSVGINPEDPNDNTALTPAYNLLVPGAPNSYPVVDASTGATVEGSWLRNDALLAVMVVTDSQDCSMPAALMDLRASYEEPNVPSEPLGSICFQPQAQAGFLDTSRMATLLTSLKGSSARVAIGFVGGVKKTGAPPAEGRSGVPSDCLIDAAAPTATPSSQCSCLDGSNDPGWCGLTQITSSAPGTLPGCDGFWASRYVGFANAFERRTFESICRNDSDAFGPTLDDFARVATLACFDLNGILPVNNDPNMIIVKRSAKGTGAAPAVLPMTSANAATQGWYYDGVNHKICLTGIDRLIGDDYDIFVLNQSLLDFTK